MSEAVLRSWDMAIHALQAQHIRPEQAGVMLSCSRTQWRAIMSRFRADEYAATFGDPGAEPRYRGIPIRIIP